MMFFASALLLMAEIELSGGAAVPTLASINAGAAMAEGATGVAVAGTNFDASVSIAFSQPGAVSVAQTTTFNSATSASINVVVEPGTGDHLAFTDSTYTTNAIATTTAGSSSALAVTVAPLAGNIFQTLTSINGTSAYAITATAGLVAGDQLEASGNSTGTAAVPSGLVLYPDATFGGTTTNFYVRAYDSVGKVWGAWALQSASVSVTGAVAATTDPGTASASGSGATTGAAAATTDPGSSAATGSGSTAGAGSATTDPGSASAAGAVGASGAASAATDPGSASATGAIVGGGNAAATTDPGSASAAGLGITAGSGAGTTDPGSAAATGSATGGGSALHPSPRYQSGQQYGAIASAPLKFQPKDPAMSVVLEFDFSPYLPTGITLSGNPTVTSTTNSGTDLAPTAVLNGAAQIDPTGTQVLVPVTGGVLDCSYLIVVVAPTTDPLTTLPIAALLPVSRDWTP